MSMNTTQVPATAPEVVEIQLQGALSGASSLACWLTNSTHHFVQLPGTSAPIARPCNCDNPPILLPGSDVVASPSGTFIVLIPADSIITLTTTTGQQKAAALVIPSEAPFPLPHSDHYDGTPGHPAQVGGGRVPCSCFACVSCATCFLRCFIRF